ncbi:MAG: ABC transporter substrate-binding protein [Cyanobacteria bacterium J06650_10]
MKRRTFTQLSGYFFASLSASSILASCGRRSSSPSGLDRDPDETLKVWWQEGFYPEEIDALRQIIADWEADSGLAIDLSVIPQKDILLEVNQALAAGNLPDVLYSGSADLTIIPKLAWENRLAEVSDVVLPQQDKYSQNALAGVSYQNEALGAGIRGYYAVPLMQSAIHIHYWEDMLINTIGESRQTIPSDWDAFWEFWLAAQPELTSAGATDTYSLGMPMSLSLDTYNNFEQFLEAYDVQILSESGELRLEDSDVRQGLIAALTDYSRFFQAEAVPPDAVDWDNTGNNVSLLSRNSLMTVNHTLSAPGSQRSDDEIYYERLSTVKWPDKPSGEPMRFVIEIKQAVLFADSNRQAAAKSFLTHLSQPENLAAYTEGAQGRYLPAMPELFEQPFWQDPKDRHISVALEQLDNTRPAYQATNPAYGEVAAQNVWGKTMRSIALETSSVEQAADEAIADIQRIFTEWQTS